MLWHTYIYTKEKTIEKITSRFIVIEKSLSSHCCFGYTVVDTKEGKEDYGDY
jgi:hypothetical protein